MVIKSSFKTNENIQDEIETLCSESIEVDYLEEVDCNFKNTWKILLFIFETRWSKILLNDCS